MCILYFLLEIGDSTTVSRQLASFRLTLSVISITRASYTLGELGVRRNLVCLF